MKAIIKFLSAGAVVIALCAGFSACNEPKQPEQNEEGAVIQAVPVSDEIAGFFNDYLTLKVLGETIFEMQPNELGVTDLSNPVERCIMFNSTNELPPIDCYGNSIEYPIFDLDSHTLIIGVFKDYGGECVTSQCLVVEQGAATMNIIVGPRNNGEFHHLTVMPGYFWGIYPKIAAETINMNVTRNR